jgi:hypothetical protein
MSTGLADVLGRPMPGVARIVLEHWRCERFRPIAILEYSLGFLCVLCLLPLLILAALMTETDLTLPNVKTRFYHRWHQLRLLLVDANGQIVASVDNTPATAEQGYAAVASVLEAASREGIVVVEVIVNGSLREVAEVWYGGRPLLAHPEEANEERASSLLGQHGLEIRREPGALYIVEHPRPISVGQRILGWLLVPLVLPFVPLLLLSENGRRAVRHSWADLRAGRSQTRQVVCVRAESVSTYRERDGEKWDESIVDGAELLGITFSPSLGYDQNVTPTPATLRLIGRHKSATLPLIAARQAERALRDLLVAATLRLRRERPELGLLGAGPHPTRCPFCAALFVMEAGSRCPSCGAFAGTTP